MRVAVEEAGAYVSALEINDLCPRRADKILPNFQNPAVFRKNAAREDFLIDNIDDISVCVKCLCHNDTFFLRFFNSFCPYARNVKCKKPTREHFNETAGIFVV